MSNNNIRFYYIYLTTNNINGKNYVGQHYGLLDDSYIGSGKLILRAIDKYGRKNFSKKVIAVCNSYDKLNILETVYIELYKSIGKAEYNIDKGGKGAHHPVESLIQQSKSLKRYYKTKEGKLFRQHLHEINIGKGCSQETKELIKKKSNNYWNSPEGQKQKQINSERHKGRKHSEEQIEKARISNTGKKRTVEQNKANSERIKKLWKDSKYRKQLSDSHKKLKWWTDGENNVQSRECPPGFRHGRSSKAMSNVAPKGRKYYNNGIIEVMRFECPEGFVPGRCPKSKQAISKGNKKRTKSNINNKE